MLRELSELLLILAAVLGCVEGNRSQAKWCALRAMGMGVLLGITVVVSLPSGASKSQLNAVAAIVMGVATLWVTVSLMSSNRSLTEYVESRLPGVMIRKGSRLVMMGFCAFVGFQETLETGIFLKAAVTSQDVAGVALAVLLGVTVMALVGRSFKAFTSMPSMMAVFRMSAVLLCFLAVRLSLEGLAALLIHPGGSLHDEVRSLWSLDKTAIAPYALVITLLPGFILIKRWWTEVSVV